jgi:hypothetical protein
MLLSSRGLQNIISGAKDFTFKVNGEYFIMSRFQAEFISPSVSSLVRSDGTVDEFEINRTGAEDCFHLFSSLADGKSISIPTSQLRLFSLLCSDLGNKELIELLTPNEPPSIANIPDRLQLNATDSDIGYACKHFTSLDHSLFSVELLRTMLTDHRLLIESEDWLLTVLKSLIAKDNSYESLIDTIECQYLSESLMKEFCEFLDPISLSRMAWESICRRLCLEVHPASSNHRLRVSPERRIDFDSRKPFDGILFHLFQNCGRNPHHEGLVSVSAPDAQSKCSFPCEDLISHESKSGKWWATNNSNVPHYLQIDFKELQICPSAYSVKAHNSSCATGYFIRSWEFEGSTDGLNWECLDRHCNSTDLSQNDAVASYYISNSSVFRYLRFRMVGQTSNETWHFTLQQFEVFGRLLGEKA